MAIAQGICKNCGSLIMLEDREELCECLFCNCVFPTAEAIDLSNDSEGYEFPNETYEKRSDVKRLTVTPVFQDSVPAAVKRAEKSAAAKKEEVVEYEVSPDDVQMPKKTLRVVLAAALGFVVLVMAVALPMMFARNGNRAQLSENIAEVFVGFSVNTNMDEGYSVGSTLNGQRNTELVAVTADVVDAEAVFQTFQNFAALRGAQYGIDSSNFGAFYQPLSVTVIGADGAFVMEAGDVSQLMAASVRKLN